MAERQPISKRLRFEVFKRDKFTCQYCGKVGGQVLLHCDHVKPVAAGGETTMLNLITSCAECNLGKGARALSDDSMLAKQHRQLADLEERRQQLEMMRQWREELAQHQVDQIDIVADAFLARSKFRPSDHGNISVRRWLRKFGLHEVLAAIDETFDLYYTANTSEEWNAAFNRVPKTLRMREQEKADPHIRKLLYIQGILRNRFDEPQGKYVEVVRDALGKGYPIDVLEVYAKAADGWNHYVELLRAWAKRQTATPPEPAVEEDTFNEADRLQEESYQAWFEPEWSLDLWSNCFPPKLAGIFRELAFDAKSGGRFDNAKIGPEDIAFLRGLRAVGLVQPIAAGEDLFKTDDRGNLLWSFRIVPMTPREASNAFNRHGALKLGHWNNPEMFARVDEVH